MKSRTLISFCQRPDSKSVPGRRRAVVGGVACWCGRSHESLPSMLLVQSGARFGEPEQRAGVPGDHQFFVGRNDPGRHAAVRRGRSAVRAGVGVRDRARCPATPTPRRCGGGSRPSSRRCRPVKTRPSTPPSTAASAPISLRRAVDEVVDRQPAAGSRAAEQVAHVVADAGDAEQAGLLVEHRLDLLRRQPEPGTDTGRRRDRGTGPRAHAQAVERGEAERAVDALAVLQRAQARAAAEVRDDDASVRQSPARPAAAPTRCTRTTGRESRSAARRRRGCSRGSGTSSATAGWPR